MWATQPAFKHLNTRNISYDLFQNRSPHSQLYIYFFSRPGFASHRGFLSPRLSRPCLSSGQEASLDQVFPDPQTGEDGERDRAGARQGPDVARTRYNNFCLAPDGG